MTSERQREIIDRQPVMTLQIVVAALVTGCIFFAAIALVLEPPTNLQMSDSQQPMTYALIVFALIVLTARVVVPSKIVSNGLRQLAQKTDDVDSAAAIGGVWAILQTRTIVAAALIEFLTFFSLIVYLVDKSPLALLLAVLLIIVLAAHVPTRSWTESWIEARLKAMEEERQFAGR